MYDINGDGKITRIEMRQAVKRFLESVRKMKKAQYQQMAKFMEVSIKISIGIIANIVIIKIS